MSWCATCNNMGVVSCDCGGDLCICMNNGEMDCPECLGSSYPDDWEPDFCEACGEEHPCECDDALAEED